MVSSTADRVPQHTASSVNEAIRRRTEENVARYSSSGPASIEQRLRVLDREWDTERTLQLNFALVVLLGLGLGAAFSWWWALLPGIAACFMVQHVLQGWCPPLPILRRIGFRTQREIDEERYALKALRGDFRPATPGFSGDGVSPHQALEAARS